MRRDGLAIFPIAFFPNNDQVSLTDSGAAPSPTTNDAVPATLIKSGPTGAVMRSGELNARRTPSRQRVEIGRHTFVASV